MFEIVNTYINNYTSNKTKTQLNRIRNALELASDRADNVFLELKICEQKEKMALHQRLDTLAKLPNHLVRIITFI